VPLDRFFSPGVSHAFLKIKYFLSSASHPGSRAFAEWRALYVAALFEKDKSRKIERIDRAKKALVVRARELFLSKGDHLQEQADIDDALQFLRVLEQCAPHSHPAH